MDTHLIVTVHGIGEQKPGETVDAVVGAATTQFGKDDPNYEPVVVERDVIELVEKRFNAKDRKAALFPVHLRRVRPAKPETPEKQAVFAEVYWADLSPAPKGPFWTMFDLLKVILGLGYIAMENVENNRDTGTAALVHAFTWLFYGAIAPLNAALFIGAVLMLIDVTAVNVGEQLPVLWLFALNGGLALALGLYIWRVIAKTYLVRLFGVGTTLVGAFILGVAVFGDTVASVTGGWCTLIPEADRPAWYFENLECFVELSVETLALLWLFTVSIAALMYLTVWWPPLKKAIKRLIVRIQSLGTASSDIVQTIDTTDGIQGSREIYHTVCAAMVMFWTVFSSTLWLLFVDLATKFADGVSGAEGTSCDNGANSLFQGVACRHLEKGLGSLAITTGCLIVLVVITAHLVWDRHGWRHNLYKDNESVSRVILNSRLQTIFGLSMIVIWFAVLNIADEWGPFPMTWTEWTVFSFPKPLLDWFYDKYAWVTAGLLLVGVLIYNFSALIAGGLGIVRDIVTYTVQARCALWDDTKSRKENFILRNQINSRFKRTLHYTLEAYSPKHVTIISHSQGTVIATQMLQDGKPAEAGNNAGKRFDLHYLLEKASSPPVTLVTMGSPVTHIYRRYFKEFFQVSRKRMPISDPNGNKVMTQWYNIHRSDDFVGTRIGDRLDQDEDDLAHNFDVPAGGHSGYFTDYYVWQKLYDEVKFKLFV